MEGDSLGLHLAFLHVNLVSAEYDRNALANADQVTCPTCEYGLFAC